MKIPLVSRLWRRRKSSRRKLLLLEALEAAQGEMTVRMLYEQTDIMPGSSGTILNSLERKGLVVWRPEAAEQRDFGSPRRQLYSITPAGSLELEKLREEQ